jgi:hypothetical protein
MRLNDLTAGMVVFVLLASAALLGQVNFSRWDNMETFLPAIWYAHTELLHGRFPFWNPLQNLGEPLHAFGIAGTLYPPYTAAVAVTTVMGWPQAYALDLIAIAHAAFGAIGISKLLSELGVRPAIAFSAAVSAMLSGYALILGSVWVHVLPNLAWSVWAMWGLQRVILRAGDRGSRIEDRGSRTADRGPLRAGIVMAMVALTAVFLTGHVQMAANVWLAVWLWAIAFAVSLRTFRKTLATLALIGVASALLAVPTLLPTALTFPEAHRSMGSLESGPGFPFGSLIGMLLPVIAGSDGATETNVLVSTFIGAWIVPALLLGAGVIAYRRNDTEPSITRAFVVSIAVAVIFVWLNFGPRGWLYSALHSLPVWSRFRIPFKYFERAVPLFAIAAALGLELAVRIAPPRRYALAALGLAALALSAWMLQPADQPLAWLSGTVALLTIVAIALLTPERFARALPALVTLQAIGIIAIANAPGHYKRYDVDRQRDARLTISDTIGRVLPLSDGSDSTGFTRPLARFYAPTLDGYASATGHRFALTPARLQTWFPALLSGVPSRHGMPYAIWLNPHFLGNLGVTTLVIANDDSVARTAAARAFPGALITPTPHAQLHRINTDTARAYFAIEQVPGDRAGITTALIGPAARHTAAVDGDARRRKLPPAQLTNLTWQRDRIDAQVSAPEGGLLVFSTSYSPEWIAEMDGTRQTLVPVNGMFAGVWVPAGAERVTLRIRRWPLLLGLAVGLIGLVVAMYAARRSG